MQDLTAHANLGKGAVGGDLIVKSRQDTYQYDSKQQNISGSADIDFSGKLQNANINTGKQQLNAQYAQVTNQSGIISNTSNLNVQGQGKFTAGYLITDKDQNHTQFKQGIQTQDIENHLNYQGDALQVGVNLTPKPKNSQQDSTSNKTKHQLGLSGLGYGKIDPIHKTSITKSAITDQAGLSHISTDNFNSEDGQQALNPIISNDFTNQKSRLEKELGNQVMITTEFGREIPKQIGDYAQAKKIELLAQGNIEEAQKWTEGGVYRVALHTAMGALATGTAEGAFTTGGVAAAAPQIEKLEAILTEKLANDDSPESKHKAGQAAKAIISTALLTLGETSGLDASSTMMATNVEVNNRWLHNNEIEKIFGKDGAKLKQFAKEQDISYEEAWRAVLAQAYRNGDDNFREAHQTSATAKEKRLSEAAENFLRRNGFHIVATPQE